MAVDILGTTTASGLGANRKSRMASYNPNTTGLNTGGQISKISLGTGQVKGSGGAGSTRSSNLTVGKILPFTQQTPTAQGPLISEESAMRGMTNLAGAVEKYTDDMNTLRANEAKLKLGDVYAKMLAGDGTGESGFVSLKGQSAAESFTGFSQQLDEEMKKALEGLNPAAAQKSIMAMFAMRSQYLQSASSYAVGQKEKAKADQVFAQKESISARISIDPQHAIGKYTKLTDGTTVYEPSPLKAEWFALYEPGQAEQADADWENKILTAADTIYQRKPGYMNKDGSYQPSEGLEDAKVFFETVGRSELSQENINKLGNEIGRLEDKEIKSVVASDKLKTANDKLYTTRYQNTNYVNASADMYDPQKPKRNHEDFRSMFVAKQISKQHFDALTGQLDSASKAGDDGVMDFGTFNTLSKEVTTLHKSNYIVSDSDSIALRISNSTLPKARKLDLMSRLNTKTDSAMATNRGEAISSIDYLVSITYRPFEEGEKGDWSAIGRVKTDTEQQLEFQAIKQYDDLIDSGSNHIEALEKVTKMYEGGNQHYNALPTLSGYGKPRTRDDLRLYTNMIQNSYASGSMPEEEFDRLVDILGEYDNYINKFASDDARKSIRDQ